MKRSDPNNRLVASHLREAAELLDLQGASPFRVEAYRRGAATVDALDRPVGELLEAGGLDALQALPHIGAGIAAAVRDMVETGRWSLLERLRGASEPEQRFRTLPGVGPKLAHRLQEELHVETLEALEIAAHDGRLEQVSGIGPRRAAGIRASLADRLGRRLRPVDRETAPSVPVLLDIDREYREKAAAGKLRTIAPRRFNPTGEAWLPILHTDRKDRHFTALFSNTARAHRLGRTGDWVVIYYYDHDHREGQATVVTEHRGPLSGRRVVRGRELETPEPTDRSLGRPRLVGSTPTGTIHGRPLPHPARPEG